MRELNTLQEVFEALEYVCQKLNLAFNRDSFHHLTIKDPKRFYLIPFLNNFIDSSFAVFGNVEDERLNNLENFYNSDLFQNLSRGVAGTTLYENHPRLSHVKKHLPEIHSTITKLPCVLIYSAKEQNARFFRLLFHEFIHILIHDAVQFSDDKEKEGFVRGIEIKLGLREFNQKDNYCLFYQQIKNEKLLATLEKI